MPSFDRHVFVCVNERAADNPKGSCKHSGGVFVRDALKKELAARGLTDRIRANGVEWAAPTRRGPAIDATFHARGWCTTNAG